MYVLGIESTCDETAFSVVEEGHHILSNVIASQASYHAQYGGVFPEMACRQHIDHLIPTLDLALMESQLSLSQIDLIAVAKGPGLLGALLIGINAAKALSFSLNIPFIGVNHVEAHLYASMMPVFKTLDFPCLGVILSGGHTALVKIHSLGSYELLGTTVDDAIGEAFDKVASLLDLPYPGGPEIESLASVGDPYKYSFKAGHCKSNPLNFSFSGLKTNVLYALKGQNHDKQAPSLVSAEEKPHIAASFQRTAFSDIVNKTLLALDQDDYKAVILGGGVCHSQTLRTMFSQIHAKIPLYFPPKGLSRDNAAMIAGLGYHQFLKQGYGDPLDLPAMARIPLKSH